MEVSEELCGERRKTYDERFARDKHDIEALQVHMEDEEARRIKIEQLNVQMAEILKNQQAQIKDHEMRLTGLEKRGGKKWDKVIDCIISGVVAAAVAAAMALLL